MGNSLTYSPDPPKDWVAEYLRSAYPSAQSAHNVHTGSSREEYEARRNAERRKTYEETRRTLSYLGLIP